MSLFHRAFDLAHFVFPNGGTCLEFGVYTGSTYAYQAQQILAKYRNSSIIGFDSWKGLPRESDGVWAPERHVLGKFSAPKTEVLERLAHLGVEPTDRRFGLVDGFFSDTLTDELRREIHDVIFINVDVDIHRSTLALLDFVRPLLQPGVVTYWDDWKDPRDENVESYGEHLAWSQWYPKQDNLQVETIEVNPVNQRSMLVTRVGDRVLSPPLPSMSAIRYHAYGLQEIEGSPAPECDPDYELFLRMKNRLRGVPLLKPLVRAIRTIMR
jgi:hypothetical protein